MKPKQHTLQILADNLEYFNSLISAQSDPSQLTDISTQLELRIDILFKYIRKDGVNVTRKELASAFSLLGKYITLWKRCFKNRPRPQWAWIQKERRRKAKSAAEKNAKGTGSDFKFYSPY